MESIYIALTIIRYMPGWMLQMSLGIYEIFFEFCHLKVDNLY